MRNNFVLRWIVPKKRIGRLAFAERMVATLLVIFALMLAVTYFLEPPLPKQLERQIFNPKMLLLWLIVFWVFFSWHISRLHDIGKGISGRWLVIILCIFILISFNIDLILEKGEGQTVAWMIVFVASTALPIVILDALLLAAPGNTRENRHGPAPDGHDSICIFLSSKFRRANIEQRQITRIHSKLRSIYGSSLKIRIVCWVLGVLVLLGEIIALPVASTFFWGVQGKNVDRLLGARSLNRAIKYDVAWAVDMWIAIGADPNAQGSDMDTPLHYAAITGNSEIVEKLLEAGANPNVQDRYTKTPLHYAASEGNNPEVIEILIKTGADPNAQDSDMDTPLHAAVAYSRNLDVIKALIKFGSHVHIKNRKGKTPLNRAIDGRREALEILYKAESQK